MAPRLLASTSVARTRAVIKAAFNDARKRRLIDWDPWDAVATIPLKDVDAVDPDMVMTTAQVRELAAVCATGNPQWESFILLMGFCGLRPSEAIGLRISDFSYVGTRVDPVTSRASHSAVSGQFLDEGQSGRRSLKGRGRKARRTIPIPTQIVPPVADHLRTIRRRRSSGARIFNNSAGNAVNLNNFYRDVWYPARGQVFPAKEPLHSVTPHDLRHTAITAWLNAGVPLKTAQSWSGHKTLSVLLDTYVGVMHQDEIIARQRFEQLIDHTEYQNPAGPSHHDS